MVVKGEGLPAYVECGLSLKSFFPPTRVADGVFTGIQQQRRINIHFAVSHTAISA